MNKRSLLNYGLIGTLIFVTWAFLLPALVSARSNLALTIGFILMVGSGISVGYIGLGIIKDLIKGKKDKGETK